MRPFCAQVFLALLLFAGVASAQEQPRTFRVPFHTVNGMILLDGEVNGKPAALLLDTGAQFTLVSAKAANLVTVALFTLSVNGSVAIPATSLAPTLAAGNGGAVNTMLWYYPQVINAKASTVVQYSTTFTNGTGCSGFQYYVQPSLLQIQ